MMKQTFNARQQLGGLLKKARRELGIKQEQAAAYLGIPVSAVSALERGQRNVEATELFHLSKLYQKPIVWFFGEAPEGNPSFNQPSAQEESLFLNEPLLLECFSLLRQLPAAQRHQLIKRLRQWLTSG